MKKSNSNAKQILPIFGAIFYAFGIITFLYALMLLINGDLEIGHQNDTTIFFAWVVGSVFIGSWGALLIGVGKIASKE